MKQTDDDNVFSEFIQNTTWVVLKFIENDGCYLKRVLAEGEFFGM